ncbi:hypothetical protein ASG62_06775 [Aureimonas sp. Leaf427]|nr:hypothetical protein ASG62_06775 [Aureimonas sp. Leaf427]
MLKRVIAGSRDGGFGLSAKAVTGGDMTVMFELMRLGFVEVTYRGRSHRWYSLTPEGQRVRENGLAEAAS